MKNSSQQQKQSSLKTLIKDAAAVLKTGNWNYITKPVFNMQVLDIASNNVFVLVSTKLIHKNNKYSKKPEEERQEGTSSLEHGCTHIQGFPFSNSLAAKKFVPAFAP